MKKHALYAQSGGVTSVIDASAAGVIDAINGSNVIDKLYAGLDGILGVLHENLVDVFAHDRAELEQIKFTPGGAFGSCRYKLKSLAENEREYHRLIDVFAAHDIGYFFYNGGGDSQDTALKVYEMSQKMNYPLTCIGIPKTIDNDLPLTDTCPGFGSVAKYVAISTLEAAFDVYSMRSSSTKVFIHEVMGRHAGFIAAASALSQLEKGDPPHIILFPEVVFDPKRFIQKVDETVKTYGFCVIVASEGIKDQSGRFLSESGLTDAFGHAQLGGVAPKLAQMIKEQLNLKYHYAISDYLQRSARHIASLTDFEQAYALGKHAVRVACEGQTGIMVSIERLADEPYEWGLTEVPLASVANVEKKLPPEFIGSDQFSITQAARRYMLPLIQGEAYPPYRSGLPQYLRLEHQCVVKKLKPF